jgi:hypothetical protein
LNRGWRFCSSPIGHLRPGNSRISNEPCSRPWTEQDRIGPTCIAVATISLRRRPTPSARLRGCPRGSPPASPSPLPRPPRGSGRGGLGATDLPSLLAGRYTSEATSARLWAEPTAQAARSARMRARMSTPDARAAVGAASRAAWADPEGRAKRLANQADPTVHAARSARIRAALSTTEGRAANSARMCAQKVDPEHRARMLARRRA